MLQDPYGRRFYYLRLSITDVCNFRCNYCLPDGYQSCGKSEQPLTTDEITSLVASFARLGTKKIRITGGEPSLRSDLSEIIAICKQTPGIESVALTTNGYKLTKNIQQWIDAGLDRLNVSIDSLDPRKFHAITGHDRLKCILEGLDKAASLGLKSIKINSVLMKQHNYAEMNQYFQWVKDKPITLRFIELMQTGDNLKFFNENHVTGESIKQQLITQGWTRAQRGASAGPAEEFQHADYAGSIGLIMPYSKDFCKSCNRLRISSQGNLHLCLFGEQGLPLRELCHENTQDELEAKIRQYVGLKKETHFLQQGFTGATTHLAMLGG